MPACRKESLEPGSCPSRRFQNSRHRGADRDDAPARGTRRVQLGGRGRGHSPHLAVHAVLVQGFGFDRPKRAQADVQRNSRKADSLSLERLEQLAREVQPGGRRGDRARPVGEDGLIARDVGVDHVAAADIRRQRHAAQLLENGVGRLVGLRVRQPLAFLQPLQQPQLQRRPAFADREA